VLAFVASLHMIELALMSFKQRLGDPFALGYFCLKHPNERSASFSIALSVAKKIQPCSLQACEPDIPFVFQVLDS
jgi:hypothetical protein